VLALLAEAHHGEVTPTWTVRTVSGGTHLYYAAPAGARYGNTAGSLGWLIDTRARGGYVVAPPTSIAGHPYEVADDRPPAPLPRWLAEALTQRQRPDRWPPLGPTARAPGPGPLVAVGRPGSRQSARLVAYVRAAVAGEVRAVAEAVPGTRNHALYCAAVALGQLVAGGALAEDQAHHALADACAVHVTAGAFSAADAEATIRSGFRTGARNPRSAA
jgi:hypothetical protein